MAIKYILASSSPRRHELFAFITKDFEVISPDCDEVLPKETEPYSVPEILAVRKAMSVAKTHPDEIVVGCDTVVILDGVIFGKPKDESVAYDMLGTLSGRTHTVVSGVCICYKGKTLSFSQETDVEFYPLSDSEIRNYIAEFKPLDKAGSYGVQDGGALFIKGIRGDYYNVMGLPIAKLKREIDKLLRLAGG
ncbi:MAG: Maf family protein [Oscillospiraceae bacterium]|nr:Maf family protein [Oscillospiraceae bacterium]